MAKPASSTRPFWWGGMAAFSAAAFFFLSCLLNLAYLSGTAFPNTKNPFRERKPGTFAKWTELDIGLLRQLWQYRVVSANLNIGASALITLAFFLLLGTIMSLADAFEVHGGQGAHKASKAILVPSFIFAAALAVLDLTFNAGAVTTAAFIYSRFSIDDQTLKNLELSYMLTQSRETWILAMLWFFFGVGLSTAIYLNARHGMLYKSWNVLTGLIVVLCFVGFLADVARLRWWMISTAIDISLTVLVWFLFMPIWLVWIGIYLISQPAGPSFTPVPVTGPPREMEHGNGAYGGRREGGDQEMTSHV